MPVKSHGSPVEERVLVSQTSVPDNSYRTLTSVSLITFTASHHQEILIDSGADTNFMDKGLARELCLGLVLLERYLRATCAGWRTIMVYNAPNHPGKSNALMVTLNFSPFLNIPRLCNLSFCDSHG